MSDFGNLASLPAFDVVAWAVEHYSPRLALACSFGGPSGMVLLDMLVQIDAAVPVLYLDTDLLFPETYRLVSEVQKRYGIRPQAVRSGLTLDGQESEHGPELWSRDPDQCCNLRKVQPWRKALADYDAWITGVRRDQADTRRETPVAAWDPQFGLVKVSPLATWSEEDVWTYIRQHDVPYNALHDSGYPSIGCVPCTRTVAAGGPLRAGRWAGFAKTECGLHARPRGEKT